MWMMTDSGRKLHAHQTEQNNASRRLKKWTDALELSKLDSQFSQGLLTTELLEAELRAADDRRVAINTLWKDSKPKPEVQGEFVLSKRAVGRSGERRNRSGCPKGNRYF